MIPIHADTNISYKYMENILEGTNDILVTSIFYTLQGEAFYAGHPAVFVRTAGCNFGAKTGICQMCDTSFEMDKAKRLSVMEIVAMAQSLLPKGMKFPLLVITGGEPTLQPNLKKLIRAWHDLTRGTVQIETNGTQVRFFDDPEFFTQTGCPCIVCSPKANEITKVYPPIRPIVEDHVDCYKFLLSADEDSVYHTIPPWVTPNRIIYVSPIAVYKKAYDGEISSIWDTDLIDVEATRKNYAYAAKYVTENSGKYPWLRLSLQTHLFTAIP